MPRLDAEARAKISATLKTKWGAELSQRLKARWDAGLMPKPIIRTPEMRKRSSIRMRSNNPMKNPVIAARVAVSNASNPANSERMKRSWREGKIKPRSTYGAQAISPNKSEIKLLCLIQQLQLPFEFVGNGAFWIGPCVSGIRRNPDFLDKTRKRVILLHGRYWHTPEAAEIEHLDYELAGWHPVVIWEEELLMSKRDALKTRLQEVA